jgi:hypothetical protein
MLNRRYALLGWAVWQVGKRMAKQRVKRLARSKGGKRMVASTPGGTRSIGIAPVVPVAAGLAAAGAWFFFRHRGAEQESELVG